MATLTYDDESTREGYLAWSVVLMKRGLRPKTEIEIHGPHPAPADKMWGSTECRSIWNVSYEIELKTASCNSIWDILDVRAWDKSTGERFPEIPSTRLPAVWRQEMKELQRERNRIRRELI